MPCKKLEKVVGWVHVDTPYILVPSTIFSKVTPTEATAMLRSVHANHWDEKVRGHEKCPRCTKIPQQDLMKFIKLT